MGCGYFITYKKMRSHDRSLGSLSCYYRSDAINGDVCMIMPQGLVKTHLNSSHA
jgi:hypothetical protein